MSHAADRPDILVLPPVLVGGSLLLGVFLHWLWPITLLPLLPARVFGATIFVLAGILAHFAQNAMKRAGTNIWPTQSALALVTEGPFRFTRNPLYLAAAGVYLGVTLWVNGLLPLLLFAPMVYLLHWGIVLPEERYLATTFGEPYSTYKSRVRRWL
jgi:protein-S-isoprenylcysteine O-methyltransferase Ste14